MYKTKQNLIEELDRETRSFNVNRRLWVGSEEKSEDEKNFFEAAMYHLNKIREIKKEIEKL